MKSRSTPAFDRSVAALEQLQAKSLEEWWSPKRLRIELRERRTACRAVWRRAIRKVFGLGVRDLPDTRQVIMASDGRPWLELHS